MAVQLKNNAATTLSADITSSATSISVSDGSVFPTLSGSDYTYATFEDVDSNREIVKVTAISSNTLTVVRAQDGTTARAFSDGDKCELRITAALLNDIAAQADTDTNTEYTAGSGLTLTGTEFSNSAPDQTVTLTGGTGITTSGTYPNFTVTNSSPDQTVSLTGSGATTVSGTYPNFTISSTDTNTDTDTTYTAGSGLTLTGTTFSNSAPDQTVTLTGSGATSVSGTYPNFTISSTDTNTDTNTEYTAGSGITLTGTVFSNSAPDQTVTLTGSGNTTVSGTYPNFTISSTGGSIDGTTINPSSVQIGGTTVIDSSRNVILGDAVLSHDTSAAWRGLTIQNNGDSDEATVDGKSSDGTQQFVVYGGSQSQGFLKPTDYSWRFKVPLTGSFLRDNAYTVWDSGNDGSGSGLDADLLDGYHLSTTRNAANTVPVRDSNGYLQLGWINTTSGATGSTIDRIYASYDGYIRYVTPATLISQISAENGGGTIHRLASNGYSRLQNWTDVADAGLYSTNTNGAHFYPNTAGSYGTWRINGSRGGYSGIYHSNGGGVVGGMFDSSGNGGDYNSSSGWHFYYHRGNDCLGISGSGTSSSYSAYVSGALYATGNITAYSDRRIKENIVTLDSALDKVNALRGVYYNKIDDPEKTKQIGFIAQEVNEVVPELVTYAEDVDQYGVNYGNATALLVEAVKDLTQQVKDLKAEIEELKNA